MLHIRMIERQRGEMKLRNKTIKQAEKSQTKPQLNSSVELNKWSLREFIEFH